MKEGRTGCIPIDCNYFLSKFNDGNTGCCGPEASMCSTRNQNFHPRAISDICSFYRQGVEK